MLSDPKLTFFWAPTMLTHIYTPFSLSECDLCSHSKPKPVSAGLRFGGGFPDSPLRLHVFLCRQVGQDGHQSVHTLSARGLLQTHPSSGSRKLLQMMARSSGVVHSEETPKNILHLIVSAWLWNLGQGETERRLLYLWFWTTLWILGVTTPESQNYHLPFLPKDRR